MFARIVALAFVVATQIVHGNEMQTASCAAKCAPLKQTYCALDGILPTYSTSYTSQCNCLTAKCKNKKVQCLAKGPCNPLCLKKLTDVKNCPPGVVRPVCGSNGVTYDNLCYLKAARCLDSSVQFLSPGKCPTKMNSCGINKCSLTKSKVCGTIDGSTILKFQNSCFLTAATCINAKIQPTSCPAKSLRSLASKVTLPPKPTASSKPSVPTLPSKTSSTTPSTTAAAASKSGSSSSDADLSDDVGSLTIPVDVSGTDDDILISDDLMDDATSGTSSSNGNTTTTAGSSTQSPLSKLKSLVGSSAPGMSSIGSIVMTFVFVALV